MAMQRVPHLGPKRVAGAEPAGLNTQLRTRLEGKGLHTRTQKNGKLVLVMVNLRGTEDDAFNLREDLRHMKLGVPIMVSQKPVSNKPQKAGR